MQYFLTEFIDKLVLTEEDRASLKEKRGFYDAVIDSLKFKSCGYYIKELCDQFDEKQLKKHKIIDDNGEMNSQLLSNRILIPYLSKDGNVEKIRPHKLGFRGDGVAPYCDLLFRRDEELLVITEGEFKAAAAFQYNINCISIPGITSFSRNNYDDLVGFISSSKIKEIIILFDREIKDDPAFDNYKKDWKSRHDTEIYSYIMAEKLTKDKYRTRICRLPNEWMVDGKADIDSCLADGRSKSDMLEVLKRSLDAKEFKDQLRKDNKPKVFAYINNRFKKFFEESPVLRNDNRYYSRAKKEGDPNMPISNFVVDIIATYKDTNDDSLRREVVLTNELGERSTPMVLRPEDMINKSSFTKFCYSNGNYIWTGGDTFLNHIWSWEFMSDQGRKIFELDHVGKVDSVYLKNKDIWITRDVMFYEGEEVYSDDSGVFWVDDVGFKIKSIDDSGDSGTCLTPIISNDPMDMDVLKDKFVDLMGNKAKLLLGWAIFSLVHEYIPKVKESPYPFLVGEKASGKTTACAALMALFGMPDFGSTMTDITTVAITRIMGYYSSIPIWLDEFSNDQRVRSKESHLKSVYNRQPVIKGIRKQFGVASYKIRSHLILSGETGPETDGMKTRSVILETKLKGDKSDTLRWLEDNKDKLGYFMYYVLKNRVDLSNKCQKEITSIYEALHKMFTSIDARTSKHFSYFAGCYQAVYGKDEEFLNWLGKKVQKQRETIAADEIYQFFEDMQMLFTSGSRANVRDFITYDEIQFGKPTIIFWFKGIYDLWKDKYGKIKEIHQSSVIRDSIGNRNYYIDKCRERLNDQRKHCVAIDYLLAPEPVRDLVDTLRSEWDKASDKASESPGE